MKCSAITPPTAYKSEPRPCAKRNGVKPHRLGKLCAHHRDYADRHGSILTKKTLPQV